MVGWQEARYQCKLTHQAARQVLSPCNGVAGVCYNGKGWLHFVPEKAKINAAYYTDELLPLLLEDCHQLLGDNFVFQQDGAPAHTAAQAQEWLKHHCPDFMQKDAWPPNSPDLNPLDFCVWGVMLDRYEKFSPKPTTISELKSVLEKIWTSLPEETIRKAVLVPQETAGMHQI